MRVALEIEFDGAGFSGTQIQTDTGERTLQGLLTEVLTRIIGTPVMPMPASRLDAGVGAEALPVSVEIPHLPGKPAAEVDGLRNLGLALAGMLPADVSVRRVAAVPPQWHAQIYAITKTYRYQVLVRGTKPSREQRCWWVKHIDHPQRLQQLADQLIGTKDLRRFACLRHDDTDTDDGARAITAATWEASADAQILHITGSGFLYKQIRGFVGAMVHVAQGRRTMVDFARLVAGEEVRRMGNLAPPEGLVLERVAYSPEPEWLRL